MEDSEAHLALYASLAQASGSSQPVVEHVGVQPSRGLPLLLVRIDILSQHGCSMLSVTISKNCNHLYFAQNHRLCEVCFKGHPIVSHLGGYTPW